jgi:hypothetical protein
MPSFEEINRDSSPVTDGIDHDSTSHVLSCDLWVLFDDQKSCRIMGPLIDANDAAHRQRRWRKSRSE